MDYSFSEEQFEALRRAHELLRRALARIPEGDLDDVRVALESAVDLLARVIARARPVDPSEFVSGFPVLAHPALAEAAEEIVTELLRADQLLSAEVPGDEVDPLVDSLTGLASYGVFREEMARLAATVGPLETCWVLLADIDQFRAINDQYDNATGDGYLLQLAGRLREVVPSRFILARLGGDEFAALVHGLSLEQALAIAEQLRASAERFSAPIARTLSLGLAGWLPASESPEDAVRRADQALFRAKGDGGNRVHVDRLDDEGHELGQPAS
jgi:diguanylate cyclase (GGDEF)-like protein